MMSELSITIPIARPVLDESEAEAVKQTILTGWVTQGPQVQLFEKEFAEYVGSKYACAVSSCTTALHLALLTIGVKPGDEVITVSHSFIATANSIRYCGAIPLFIDIEPHTYNMDPLLLEKAITKNTRAILCVHQMGMPCNLQKILDIAHSYNLPVIEDAACAIGSEIFLNNQWDKIGKPHGDIACFSFHPRKVITTGDGGMLTTSNEKFDRQFRLLRQHGMSISDSIRHQSKKIIFEEYPILGYNYRMTDIQASIGRIQLERLPNILNSRRNIAKRYHTILKDIKGLILPKEHEWARSNWQSYCVVLSPKYDQLSIMQYLLDHGISTRRGVMCAHLEPAYQKVIWKESKNEMTGSNDKFCNHLSVSENIQNNSVILPLYPQMTINEQDKVVSILNQSLNLNGPNQ